MKKPAFVFASEVDNLIEALSPDDYRTHHGRAKRLLEELLPISRLGLLLKQPGLHVEVEAFEDYGPADGRIAVTGFREQLFDVQVTCDFTYSERLRSELVSSVGSAPGAGPTSRDRRTGQIKAAPIVVDMDAHYENIATAVRDLSIKKAARVPGANAALVIAFDEIRLSGAYSWRQMHAALDRKGGLSSGDFFAIYLFNGASNEIQRAA